jgi:hypothetical protein
MPIAKLMYAVSHLYDPAVSRAILDRLAGTVDARCPGCRPLTELLLLVNAVADVCSDNDADIDRLLDLAWNGARRTVG